MVHIFAPSSFHMLEKAPMERDFSMLPISIVSGRFAGHLSSEIGEKFAGRSSKNYEAFERINHLCSWLSKL